MSNGSAKADAAVAVTKAEDELRKEVQRLNQQLEELSTTSAVGASRNGSSASSIITMAPPEKSGYLFKWQDRSIGWEEGGYVWCLFLVMHATMSSYLKNFLHLQLREVRSWPIIVLQES